MERAPSFNAGTNSLRKEKGVWEKPLRGFPARFQSAPTFDTLIFEEIRKYARDFFKGTIVGRTVFHKELPFAVFCSMDFDVCP